MGCVRFSGCLSMSSVQRPIRHSVVCEAAPTKKADSAVKRARQAEKRRIYNKARKSEVRTRMKKVIPFPKMINFLFDGNFFLPLYLSRFILRLLYVNFVLQFVCVFV